MKKISFLLIILVAITTVGQNTFPSNGNVGIGTSSPNSKLVIASNDYGITVNPNGEAGGLGFNRNAFDGAIFNSSKSAWQFSARDEMFTLEGYSGAEHELFSILKNGNFGIGTFSPSVKLDVNSRDVAAFFRSSTNSVPVSIINSGSSVSTIGFKGTSTATEYNVRVGVDGNDFISYTNNTERLRIDSNGNLGIGTAKPTAILDIYTKITAPIAFNSQNWSTSNSDYSLMLQTVWTTYGGINQQFIQKFNGVDYTSLSFFQGKVGIGNTTPDEKLTVKGKIHAEEVRIDLSIPAPDYVFASDYKLKTLQEVEAYIKQNSHLPEIPSSQEIEKNGLMLAEMNMNLLKKVEELTLYAIEQNKKIEGQSKEIESLKNLVLRVAKIETELKQK